MTKLGEKVALESQNTNGLIQVTKGLIQLQSLHSVPVSEREREAMR